jgi:hypothetical protein
MSLNNTVIVKHTSDLMITAPFPCDSVLLFLISGIP